MRKLERGDLWTLERYAEERIRFREKVMAHKKSRSVHLGPHCTLLFEDRITIRYQVQEMLRTERIFERAPIQDELDAYNPLIPDGGNLKATMMLEYDDAEERKQALAAMIGIEDRVWMRVAGFEPVFAIADEDMQRATEDKTSSVHFLRFEFAPAMRIALGGNAGLSAGIDHRAYRHALDPLPDALRAALIADFA
ncbi:MAG: DUF3501 family protein [Pseudomonadota bacterium]|nr:DUF3501 family protein [Pseudomonadota bacterium]